MHERLDLDELVRAMRVARVAGAEVDRRNACSGEVGDVRPGLLRLDAGGPRFEQRCDQRAIGDDSARVGVTHDLEGRTVRDERPQVLLGLARGPVRRVPEVQSRHRAPGNDVVRDPRLEPRHREHLHEGKSLDLCPPVREREERRQPLHGPLDRAVGVPGPGRVAAPAVEREVGDHVAETAGVDETVGRLEDDRERRLVSELRAREQCGERVVLHWQLLAPEEQESHVEG